MAILVDSSVLLDIIHEDPVGQESSEARRGGRRTRTLPEFFIGAHWAVRGYDLLTRDPKRIRRYFPTATIIEP